MKRRILTAAVVFCLAAVGGLLWPVSDTHALPSQEVFCDFYSDDTYTTLVGRRLTVCCIGVRVIGEVTSHSICWDGIECGGCMECGLCQGPGGH